MKPTKKHIGLRVRMEVPASEQMPHAQRVEFACVIAGFMRRPGGLAVLLEMDGEEYGVGRRHCRIVEVLPDAP